MSPEQQVKIAEIRERLTLWAGPDLVEAGIAWLTKEIEKRECEEGLRWLREICEMIKRSEVS